jgi:hypothetical protein
MECVLFSQVSGESIEFETKVIAHNGKRGKNEVLFLFKCAEFYNVTKFGIAFQRSVISKRSEIIMFVELTDIGINP